MISAETYLDGRDHFFSEQMNMVEAFAKIVNPVRHAYSMRDILAIRSDERISLVVVVAAVNALQMICGRLDSDSWLVGWRFAKSTELNSTFSYSEFVGLIFDPLM